MCSVIDVECICCIRNSVLSLSLGGSRAFFCHGAKDAKVTFGWCGTEGLYPELSGLCFGGEGSQ